MSATYTSYSAIYSAAGSGLGCTADLGLAALLQLTSDGLEVQDALLMEAVAGRVTSKALLAWHKSHPLDSFQVLSCSLESEVT